MVRGQVTPTITFAEVQIIAEQIGTAGRSLSLPIRYSPRLISAGSVPVRPKTSVAAMAESVVSSPHELPIASVHSRPSALVAATDYAAHSEPGSELSAVGSARISLLVVGPVPLARSMTRLYWRCTRGLAVVISA
jgi:hypothetical protein